MTEDWVRQADPRAGYLAQKTEIDSAIAAVLEGGQYILGPEVEAFERDFAVYLGAAHAIGTSSGTDAITLGLRALGVAPGDGVASVSHTATATIAAIEMAGATPVFIDVEPDSFSMDPAALGALLAHPPMAIKAVLPVHLYGRPAAIVNIAAIARRHGAAVLEDASQAHGAAVGDRKLGRFGALAAFSLYPTKNLGALGDAGVLVTDDDVLQERCRSLRQYGWRGRYASHEPGMNCRLDELQAAALRIKLRRLDLSNDRRRAIARAYDEGLAGLDLILPTAAQGQIHAYHQYVVRVPERDRLRSTLAQQGIATAVHYPAPVHLQPAYLGRFPIGPTGLSTTERLAGEILSLPIYPELADAHVARVVDALRAAISKI